MLRKSTMLTSESFRGLCSGKEEGREREGGWNREGMREERERERESITKYSLSLGSCWLKRLLY